MQTFKIYYADGNQKYKKATNLKVLLYWLIKNDTEVNDITKIEVIPIEIAKKLN